MEKVLQAPNQRCQCRAGAWPFMKRKIFAWFKMLTELVAFPKKGRESRRQWQHRPWRREQLGVSLENVSATSSTYSACDVAGLGRKALATNWWLDAACDITKSCALLLAGLNCLPLMPQRRWWAWFQGYAHWCKFALPWWPTINWLLIPLQLNSDLNQLVLIIFTLLHSN